MRSAVAIAALVWATWPADAHEIYTGLRGKDGQLCCGADDCEPTLYQIRKGHYFFLTREKHWIEIPEDRITFLPVPGDQDITTPNHAHLCYRASNDFDAGDIDRMKNVFSGEGQSIYLWCAFIPPGSI